MSKLCELTHLRPVMEQSSLEHLDSEKVLLTVCLKRQLVGEALVAPARMPLLPIWRSSRLEIMLKMMKG